MDNQPDQTHSRKVPISARDILASLCLLFAVAVALPLLDLLGRNATFFVVRDAPAVEVIALGVIVALLAPLIAALLAILVHRIHPTAGAVIHGALFVLLAGLLWLSILRATPLADIAGWAAIAIAIGGGLLVYLAYVMMPTLRLGVRWTWVVPIAVLGIFLFASSTSQLIFGTAQASSEAIEVRNPAPVVFVVFDALALSDLIDGSGNVQAQLYPNFARLASGSTWYRNAITLHPGTEKSIPTILSGIEANGDQVPLLNDFPNNLFTLLDESYVTTAAEPITKLCPPSECQAVTRARVTTAERWRSLVSDLRVIAGHLFLPVDLTSQLPPIDETWGGFDDPNSSEPSQPTTDSSPEWDVRAEFQAALAADRRKSIVDFVDQIEKSDEPTLRFLHAVVPHSPYNYLENGHLSDLPEGRHVSRNLPEGYVDDPWRIEQVHQLHLIQVGYVDHVLGSILDRLEAEGTYDESLIVVLADHGETFRPGMPRLRDRVAVIEDVLPIPLFIKAPFQDDGLIDDYRAYTTDVIPTVAAILGIELPWAVDGTSLLEPERPDRPNSRVTGADGDVEFPGDISKALAAAEARIARFGPNGPYGLAPEGYADLLGRDVDSFRMGDSSNTELVLRDPGRWNNVDIEADTLPVSVRGRLDHGNRSDVIIAIEVNGVIQAVTQSYLDANGDIHFDAMLPPECLKNGANEINFFALSDSDGVVTLHRLG